MEVAYRTNHFEFRYSDEKGYIDTEFLVLSAEGFDQPRSHCVFCKGYLKHQELILENFNFGMTNPSYYDGTPFKDLTGKLKELEEARDKEELDDILMDLYWDFYFLAMDYC